MVPNRTPVGCANADVSNHWPLAPMAPSTLNVPTVRRLLVAWSIQRVAACRHGERVAAERGQHAVDLPVVGNRVQDAVVTARRLPRERVRRSPTGSCAGGPLLRCVLVPPVRTSNTLSSSAGYMPIRVLTPSGFFASATGVVAEWQEPKAWAQLNQLDRKNLRKFAENMFSMSCDE